MTSSTRLMRTVQLAVLLAALVLGVAPVFAVHTTPTFEVDGDATNSGTAGDDWGNALGFAPPPAPAGTTTIFAVAETPNKSFVIGTKDLDDVSSGGVTSSVWRWDEHSVPDKDRLTNAYAARYANGILYFGADRFANNGDAMLGFWFFQGVVSLNPDGTFNGVHRIGDLLILSNFVNGGKTSEIRVYVWDPAGCTPNDGCPTLRLRAAGMSSTGNAVCDPTDVACAVTNPVGAASPWAYTPKFGPSGTFPVVSFFEGGVNLAALGLADECFASFLAETRASQSVTASSKDFILSGFQPCNPAIRVTKECTAVVNSGGTGVIVSVGGQVCNTGDVDLTGVQVVDDHAGGLLSNATLAPSVCASYSGSYTSSSVSNSDTVTATGTGARNSGTVTASAPATCQAAANKGINVNKVCDLDLAPVTLQSNEPALAVVIDISGQVCNTGNVALTDVHVVDNRSGTVLTGGTLAPAACLTYNDRYIPDQTIALGDLETPSTVSFTDQVTATGTAALGLGGVSAQSAVVECFVCK
jgi:hypothetical protein